MSNKNNGYDGERSQPVKSDKYDGEREQPVKSVSLVLLISTIARCISLAGNMSYTAWFGYTLETDIYTYAVNLPNIIFTCIGTALVTVVIPIFAGRLGSGDKEKAYSFIDNVITVSLIFAAAVALAGIAASPAIVGMIGKFNAGNPSLALFSLRLMFPVILFHAVNYVLQGVLQSNARYLMPAAVSALSGFAILIYIGLFAERFGIRGLLVATFVGLAAQALFLVYPTRRFTGYRYRPSLRLADGDMRLAGRLALPVLVAPSPCNINMFLNSTFAARFEGGVLTVTNMLTLAFTASQLFIISALSVFFPKMSAKYATGDVKGFLDSYRSVLRLIIIFAVPASAALAYLSRFLIPLLYGRGKVTQGDISISITVFSIYACSIASIGFKEAADRAFYSIRDSRTPAAVSIAILIINVALSLLLMKAIGLAGLPAAYLIAISSGAAMLLLILRSRIKRMAGRNDVVQPDKDKKDEIFSLAFKCILSTCIMLVALLLTEAALGRLLPALGDAFSPAPVDASSPALGGSYSSALYQVICIVTMTVTGGLAYAAAAYAMHIAEFRNFLSRRVAELLSLVHVVLRRHTNCK